MSAKACELQTKGCIIVPEPLMDHKRLSNQDINFRAAWENGISDSCSNLVSFLLYFIFYFTSTNNL